MAKSLTIFSDGGCIGNPGIGGWAYIILEDNKEIFYDSGSSGATTNNKMELTAVIKALTYLEKIGKKGIDVEINTDSQYVKNGITDWINNWKKNGWKTANKKAVKNQEYWKELDQLTSLFNIKWKWVKGHSGDQHNERCDTLVQQEMEKLSSSG